MRILGVDLLSGSVNSKVQPRYSIVLLEDGVIKSRSEVSRQRLLRVIRELKPDRIACDNVYELFKKNRARSFYYLLPENTKIVQVNGYPRAQQPLHQVARRYGVDLSSKASSMEEAEACALLASRNVGYYAEIFRDESRVIVSRARSPGKGGQSQDRYRRKVHAMVGQKIREVEASLKEEGISYELSLVRADYGYSKGEFHIRAPLASLRGIKRSHGPDVQVKKLPLEREKLEFLPMGVEDKAVIVGIDPGTTIGLAVIDLKGELCEVFSSRNFSQKDVLSYLIKYRPVLVVASDVAPAPKLVEKISSSLNAVLYTPPHTLSVTEKKSLVDARFTRDSYANPHERDAIAAALKAYNHFKPKLEQVDKRLERSELAALSSTVKSLAIKGMSIHRAIKSLTKPKEGVKAQPKPREEPKKRRGIIRTLKEEIRLLREEREELRRALRSLERKAAKLELELDRARKKEREEMLKDEEIRRRDREIAALKSLLQKEKESKKALQKELRSLRRAKLVESSEDLALVKVLPKFSKEELHKARDRLEKGDIVLLLDPAGGGRATAERLLKQKPRAIITERSRIPEPAAEALKEALILSPEGLNIKLVENFGVVDKASLEEKIAREEERRKLRAAIRREKWLQDYLVNYRRKRLRH
jgi:hypothetical protein